MSIMNQVIVGPFSSMEKSAKLLKYSAAYSIYIGQIYQCIIFWFKRHLSSPHDITTRGFGGFLLNGLTISSCIKTLWWLDAAKTCTAPYTSRFPLILIFLYIGAPWRHRLAFEMRNIHFGYKTCHCSMTCSMYMHSADGWKDGFTMFNVYISGPAVTQGCNVVGSKHGNISRLVSGYSGKIKTCDKLLDPSPKYGNIEKSCIIFRIEEEADTCHYTQGLF